MNGKGTKKIIMYIDHKYLDKEKSSFLKNIYKNILQEVESWSKKMFKFYIVMFASLTLAANIYIINKLYGSIEENSIIQSIRYHYPGFRIAILSVCVSTGSLRLLDLIISKITMRKRICRLNYIVQNCLNSKEDDLLDKNSLIFCDSIPSYLDVMLFKHLAVLRILKSCAYSRKETR